MAEARIQAKRAEFANKEDNNQDQTGKSFEYDETLVCQILFRSILILRSPLLKPITNGN